MVQCLIKVVVMCPIVSQRKRLVTIMRLKAYYWKDEILKSYGNSHSHKASTCYIEGFLENILSYLFITDTLQPGGDRQEK